MWIERGNTKVYNIGVDPRKAFCEQLLLCAPFTLVSIDSSNIISTYTAAAVKFLHQSTPSRVRIVRSYLPNPTCAHTRHTKRDVNTYSYILCCWVGDKTFERCNTFSPDWESIADQSMEKAQVRFEEPMSFIGITFCNMGEGLFTGAEMTRRQLH